MVMAGFPNWSCRFKAAGAVRVPRSVGYSELPGLARTDRARHRSHLTRNGSRKDCDCRRERPVSPRSPGALNRYFEAGGEVAEGVVVLLPAGGAIS